MINGIPPADRSRYDVAFYCPQATGLIDPLAELPTGGAEAQILMLAGGLADHGHRVALIVRGHPGNLPRRFRGIDIVPQRQTSFSIRVLAGCENVFRTMYALVATPAETYVQRGAGGVTALVWLAAWLRRARFVYSSANVIDFDFGRLQPLRRHVKLYEAGVRHAAEVVVQTDEQVSLCHERFGRKPRLIASIAESQPLRRHQPSGFLWAARAAPYKRPDQYVDLARRLPDVEFRMVLVPADATGAAIVQQVREAATGLPNLTFLPPRPREQMGELIASSVAVVNTSEYEGLSNVSLEGWARGVPSLALHHDPDGLIETEGLGGFAHGSIEELARLAEALWSSRSDQHQVARRCRAYVAGRHSLDAIVADWEQVLELSNRDSACS